MDWIVVEGVGGYAQNMSSRYLYELERAGAIEKVAGGRGRGNILTWKRLTE